MNEHYHPFNLKFWFGQVDTRALGLFRIGFALILLKDTVFALIMMGQLFSDNGIVSRAFVQETFVPRFSLMFYLENDWQVYAFFLIWIVILLCLLVGWRTRTMTILNYIFLISINARNPLTINSSDYILSILNFFACFIPLGQYYSIDAVLLRYHHNDHAETTRTTYAFPVRLMQMYFALVYPVSVIFKWLISDPIWHDGWAVYRALQFQTFTYPTADWLMDNAPLAVFQFLNNYTLIVEALFFFLIFLPFFQPFARAIGLFLGTSLHLGISFLMAIRNFSMVMITSYLVLFPAAWIKRLDEIMSFSAPHVTLPVSHFRKDLLLAAALINSNYVTLDHCSTHRQSSDWKFVVKLDDGTEIEGLAAWKILAATMAFSRLWRWTLRFRLVRHIISRVGFYLTFDYRINYQYPIPRQPSRLYRITISLLLAFFIISAHWYGLYQLENQTALPEPPAPLVTVLNTLHLRANWNMFAPPTPAEWYPKVIGYFDDNSRLDLMTGEAPHTRVTRWNVGPTARYEVLFWYLFREPKEMMLRDWASFYCRQYAHHDPAIERIDILMYYYFTSLPTESTPKSINRRLLFRHACQ